MYNACAFMSRKLTNEEPRSKKKIDSSGDNTRSVSELQQQRIFHKYAVHLANTNRELCLVVRQKPSMLTIKIYISPVVSNAAAVSPSPDEPSSASPLTPPSTPASSGT